MNNYIKITILCTILVCLNGCASYMVYKDSERKVITKKAYATEDQVAIRAVQLGSDGVGVGIELTNWEALKEQPWKQLGAALWDAVCIYLGKKEIDSKNDDNDNPSSMTMTVNGDRNNITFINGQNNTTTAETKEKTETKE